MKKIALFILSILSIFYSIIFTFIFNGYYKENNPSFFIIFILTIFGVILISSTILFQIIFIKKKRYKLITTLLTLIICLSSITIGYNVTKSSYINQHYYTKENWINADQETKYYIVKSFVNEYNLDSKDKAFVIEHLGQPDIIYVENKYEHYVYVLGIPAHSFTIDPYIFDITFIGRTVYTYSIYRS